MDSSVWPVSGWSVFQASTRTNNDVEGWHRRLNGRANRGQLQLYMLVPLLHREALFCDLQVKLVSEKKLKRRQRAVYRRMQGKLCDLWDELEDKKKTVSQFLRAVARFHGP